MTVYGKKKESSSKNKEGSSKGPTHQNPGGPTTNGPTVSSSNNSHPHPHPPPTSAQEVEFEGTGVGPTESHSHPISIPNCTYDKQPEPVNVTLRSWTHAHPPVLPLGLGTGPDLRVNPTHFEKYHPHLEPTPHHGKRRHCLSPVRTTRSKLSRVDRDRSKAGSPNPTVCSNVITNFSALTQPVPPVEPAVNIGLPMAPSPENCNSEDEYESRPQSQLTEEEWVDREKRFEKKMRKKGYVIKQMGEDGACLFRAVADQVYGDQEMHSVVRRHCMDYIAANGDYYSQYVTEDFKHYVSRKRLDHVHGNHIEIQAMSEMYNRTIEVFCYSTEPINAFHGHHKTDNAPIRLSYHRGIHYNSLVDPFKATIGVGLGLPGEIPGQADTTLLSDVARQSEEIHLEQAMLEDKLRATDWEATNEAIEEQVARESYLQWLKDNERRARGTRPPTASSSSSTVTSSSTSDLRSSRSKSTGGTGSPLGSPRYGDGNHRSTASPRHSPPPPSTPGPSTKVNCSPNPHTSATTNPTSTVTTEPNPTRQSPPPAFQYLDPSVFVSDIPSFDLNEWEDASILAQVMAASQQEYFDQIKRSRESTSSGGGGNINVGSNDLGACSLAEPPQ